MSMEYCHECDKMIDLGYDEHWEHFSPYEKDRKYFLELKKIMKGGKRK